MVGNVLNILFVFMVHGILKKNIGLASPLLKEMTHSILYFKT